MPSRPFTDDEYRSTFLESSGSLHEKALERALDIRKFEIDLYWRRAAYFWTFIAATLAGYIALEASSSRDRTDLSVLLCNLGAVFSFGWFCVNRGSKFWQENWEYHVDLLEDVVQGPLYKVILSRRAPQGIRERIVHLLTGPSKISVSKVNQLISLFVTFMWIILLFHSLPAFVLAAQIDWYYVAIIGSACGTCVSFACLARTYSGGYWHTGTIRTAKINSGSIGAAPK